MDLRSRSRKKSGPKSPETVQSNISDKTEENNLSDKSDSTISAEGGKDAESEKNKEKDETVTAGTSGNQSPDPNCSICLGKLDNKSFTDSCLHMFCFTCLLEWSKVKAECPLCKQSFKCIIHSVRSDRDYKKYDIEQLARPPPPTNNAQWLIDPLENRNFRYRTTFTLERLMEAHYRDRHRQLWGLQLRPSTSASTRLRSSGQRQAVTTDFRRRIYVNHLKVSSAQGSVLRSSRRVRTVTPEFFTSNPASVHRLVPWLNRELNALLDNNDTHVQFLLELIMDLVKRFAIEGEEFYQHIRPFLGSHTRHFTHEFMNFAQSPYDMIGYDTHVVYEPTQEAVSSNSDNESTNSDVIIVSPGNDTAGATPLERPPRERRQRSTHATATNSDLQLSLVQDTSIDPLLNRIEGILQTTSDAHAGFSGWDTGTPSAFWPEFLDNITGATTINPLDLTVPDGQVLESIRQAITDTDSDNGDVQITKVEKAYRDRSPIVLSSDSDTIDIIDSFSVSHKRKQTPRRASPGVYIDRDSPASSPGKRTHSGPKYASNGRSYLGPRAIESRSKSPRDQNKHREMVLDSKRRINNSGDSSQDRRNNNYGSRSSPYSRSHSQSHGHQSRKPLTQIDRLCESLWKKHDSLSLRGNYRFAYDPPDRNPLFIDAAARESRKRHRSRRKHKKHKRSRHDSPEKRERHASEARSRSHKRKKKHKYHKSRVRDANGRSQLRDERRSSFISPGSAIVSVVSSTDATSPSKTVTNITPHSSHTSPKGDSRDVLTVFSDSDDRTGDRLVSPCTNANSDDTEFAKYDFDDYINLLGSPDHVPGTSQSTARRTSDVCRVRDDGELPELNHHVAEATGGRGGPTGRGTVIDLVDGTDDVLTDGPSTSKECGQIDVLEHDSADLKKCKKHPSGHKKSLSALCSVRSIASTSSAAITSEERVRVVNGVIDEREDGTVAGENAGEGNPNNVMTGEPIHDQDCKVNSTEQIDIHNPFVYPRNQSDDCDCTVRSREGDDEGESDYCVSSHEGDDEGVSGDCVSSHEGDDEGVSGDCVSSHEGDDEGVSGDCVSSHVGDVKLSARTRADIPDADGSDYDTMANGRDRGVGVRELYTGCGETSRQDVDVGEVMKCLNDIKSSIEVMDSVEEVCDRAVGSEWSPFC